MAYALVARSTSTPVTRVRGHGPGRRAGLAGKGRGRGDPARAPAATPGPVPVLQTRLEVGAPDDRFEQEAERVADQVLRMPDRATVPALSSAGARRSEDETLQSGMATGAAPDVLASVEAGIHAPRGGGQPLPAAALQPQQTSYDASTKL